MVYVVPVLALVLVLSVARWREWEITRKAKDLSLWTGAFFGAALGLRAPLFDIWLLSLLATGATVAGMIYLVMAVLEIAQPSKDDILRTMNEPSPGPPQSPDR